MATPRKSRSVNYGANANDLSILFASLLPRSTDDVRPFLLDAAFALGLREAELARLLGVSRSTFSGWKLRGAIPAAHSAWFADELVFAVLSRFEARLGEDYRHAGIPIVLTLFRSTDFNPFGLAKLRPDEAIHLCYWHFGGLTRLALFVSHRLSIDPDLIDQHEHRAASLLGKLAKAAAPRLFPGREVSQ